jgi:hypothetical protein
MVSNNYMEINRVKVVKNVTGYKIKIIAESRSVEIPTRSGTPRKESRMCDTGKFGIYVGRKKLIKGGFKSLTEATDYVNTNLMK